MFFLIKNFANLYFQIKTSHSHKGPHEFDNLLYVQEITGKK